MGPGTPGERFAAGASQELGGPSIQPLESWKVGRHPEAQLSWQLVVGTRTWRLLLSGFYERAPLERAEPCPHQPPSPHLPGFQHPAQLQRNLSKGRSLIWTVPPALTHQLIPADGAWLRGGVGANRAEGVPGLQAEDTHTSSSQLRGCSMR